MRIKTVLILALVLTGAAVTGAEKPAPLTPEEAAFNFYMSQEWAKRSGHNNAERYRDYLEWLIAYRRTERGDGNHSR